MADYFPLVKLPRPSGGPVAIRAAGRRGRGRRRGAASEQVTRERGYENTAGYQLQMPDKIMKALQARADVIARSNGDIDKQGDSIVKDEYLEQAADELLPILSKSVLPDMIEFGFALAGHRRKPPAPVPALPPTYQETPGRMVLRTGVSQPLTAEQRRPTPRASDQWSYAGPPSFSPPPPLPGSSAPVVTNQQMQQQATRPSGKKKKSWYGRLKSVMTPWEPGSFGG